MKTTVEISDALLIEAKQRAAAERRPLRALVEDAIRAQLDRTTPVARETKLKWVSAKGGVPDEVSDREAMYDWLERNS